MKLEDILFGKTSNIVTNVIAIAAAIYVVSLVIIALIFK